MVAQEPLILAYPGLNLTSVRYNALQTIAIIKYKQKLRVDEKYNTIVRHGLTGSVQVFIYQSIRITGNCIRALRSNQ